MSRRNPPPARPSVEPLEAREVPSATSYLADGGRTLVVSGTAAADVVRVVQDDRAGTLTVTADGSGPAVYRSAGIGTVAVALRGGNDRFDFATVGDVRSAKQLRVDLGDGDDTAKVRWADDGAKARANLTAVVTGGVGDDAIGFRVGPLATGVTVALRADGGVGNDAVGVQAIAPGRAAALDVAFRGGEGDDTLAVYSTGDLPAGGRAGFDLRGDGGADTVSVNVGGRVGGAFDVRADGGDGDDQVLLDATNATGPGKVRAALLGGAGDDQVGTLADARAVDVVADGGPGTNAGLLIPGVRSRNVQVSRPPTEYELHSGPLPTFNPVLPTRTLVRDGRSVEYYSAGTSRPGQPVVVLITGFGGDIDTWQTVPGRLAVGSQVVAVNRPGYRGSSPATGDYAPTAVDDIRAVVRAAAGGRPVVLVGHSLGGLYANQYARSHPDEVAGVVFVDSTAPEAVTRIDDLGVPFGGLGDPTAAELRLEQPGVRQEVEGVVSVARQVLAAPAFPAVPVVSLRAGPADLLADDPQADAWYQALGSLGSPGETRRVAGSGHNMQSDRPDAVTRAVGDVVRLATPVRTRTTLLADPGSGTAGDRVALTATVSGGPATGTVTFRAGSKVLGTAPLVGGRATLVTADLPAGTTTVTAAFAGDAKFLGSTGSTTVRLAEPSADSRFVSSVLADAATKYGIPGLTAAVVIGPKVTAGATGVDAAGSTSAVSAGDLFQNGSTTKAMTATLAGVLVDRGLIRWDRTIGDVFPDLRGKVRPEYLGVTLEALLQHRGGLLADDDASPELAAAVTALDPSDPRAARIAILPVVLREPSHPAGEFRYSNAGYAVAAAMLERVTGRDYEDLMSRYVFGPLGMRSATFGPPTGTDPTGHDAAGTPVPYGSDKYLATDLAVLDPAGANLRMSVADWAKFVQAHMGQKVNGVRLLTPATLARLHTPAFPELSPGVNYAAGWGVAVPGLAGADPSLGGFLQHQGSDGFWLSEVQAYPDRGFAVLIMANSAVTADGQDASVAFAEIKARLSERFAPKPAPAALPFSGAVTDVLRQVRTDTGVPAVGGGVVAGGQTVGLATVGTREAGKPQPVTDDARFHIGSNAKSMTATLAAILVENGVIRWDTTVGEAFPEVRSRLRPGYADVTLEDLLNHRGGVGDFATDADVRTYEKFQSAARFASEGRQEVAEKDFRKSSSSGRHSK